MGLLRPGDVLAGHRIEGEAGRGGMGVVYRATNLRLKRTVALKVIAPWLAAEPGFRERFERTGPRFGLFDDERGKAHSHDLVGLRRDFQLLTTNLATVTTPLKRRLGFTACF